MGNLEKKNNCTQFLKNAIFGKLPDNWFPQKTQNDN